MSHFYFGTPKRGLRYFSRFRVPAFLPEFMGQARKQRCESAIEDLRPAILFYRRSEKSETRGPLRGPSARCLLVFIESSLISEKLEKCVREELGGFE